MSVQTEKVPSNLCKYIHRHCYQQRIEGYDLCIRHILHDKKAPFKQCMYVQQLRKKRCLNAAPVTNERHEALCPFHTNQSIKMIKKASMSRKKEKVIGSAAKVLESFEMYCKNKKHDTTYNRTIASSEKYATGPSEVCPESLKAPNAFSPSCLKENAGETFSMVLEPNNDDDHRNWGIGSDDYLRYAGVLTAKEVLLLAKQKAEHLRHLYYEELKRTYYHLKNIRRDYLQETNKKAQEIISHKSSEKQPRVSEINSLKGLFESSHRRMRKVLHYQCEQKQGMQNTTHPVCTFIQDGEKCNKVAIPCTSYCINHLSMDTNICLFKKCRFEKCDRLVLPVGEDACKLHLFDSLVPDSEEGQTLSSTVSTTEQEHFQSMDDIASLGLDAVIPGSLFGLDQFGELGESADIVLGEEQTDLMQIQPITLYPPSDILADTRKSDIEEEK